MLPSCLWRTRYVGRGGNLLISASQPAKFCRRRKALLGKVKITSLTHCTRLGSTLTYIKSHVNPVQTCGGNHSAMQQQQQRQCFCHCLQPWSILPSHADIFVCISESTCIGHVQQQYSSMPVCICKATAVVPALNAQHMAEMDGPSDGLSKPCSAIDCVASGTCRPLDGLSTGYSHTPSSTRQLIVASPLPAGKKGTMVIGENGSLAIRRICMGCSGPADRGSRFVCPPHLYLSRLLCACS